ncbi:LysR family transcriptional regulator [Shewanella sp.]|uniref:LysR family transcriptional regulator n=1 Tax=Shewanella sp. TaxID=50422 RepID=UPI003D0AD091
MRKPSLTDLEAFREVAHLRSFSKAADHLGVSRSALSHLVKGLEAYFGSQLLRRTTRSVSLTPAGENLINGLSPILSDLEQLLLDTSNDKEHLFGEVRINGSESAIEYVLNSIVPPLRAQYPGIKLDLVSDGKLSDIVEHGFDAGIRLKDFVPQDMIAIPIGSKVRFIAVASPQYLEQFPPPKTPHELHKHHCIRQRLPSGKRYHWEFSRHGESLTIDVPGDISLDNSNLMVKAAIQGLGIAFVPESYAKDQIASGRLTIILDDWCPDEPGFHVYFPQYRHMSRSLRAFLDVVKSQHL